MTSLKNKTGFLLDASFLKQLIGPDYYGVVKGSTKNQLELSNHLFDLRNIWHDIWIYIWLKSDTDI